MVYMSFLSPFLYSVYALFNIENFYPDQEELLCNFLKDEKSLISQAI
jgi:hypothetical protein